MTFYKNVLLKEIMAMVGFSTVSRFCLRDMSTLASDPCVGPLVFDRLVNIFCPLCVVMTCFSRTCTAMECYNIIKYLKNSFRKNSI